MRMYAFVKLKVRIPDTDKTIDEIKRELTYHITNGEFWIKEVEFKLQEEGN